MHVIKTNLDNTANVIAFPAAPKEKTPTIAAFEDVILQIELLIGAAKAKNEHLLFAFERYAQKNNCSKGLALVNLAKETDRHLSLALQGASFLSPGEDRGGA